MVVVTVEPEDPVERPLRASFTHFRLGVTTHAEVSRGRNAAAGKSVVEKDRKALRFSRSLEVVVALFATTTTTTSTPDTKRRMHS